MRIRWSIRVSAILIVLIVIAQVISGCGKRAEEFSDTLKVSSQEHTQGIRVMFINVGKADSILIETATSSYLIDTGTQESVPAIYRALEAMGVSKLEGVFITHTDKDHIGGLQGLCAKYNIDKLYSSDISGQMDKIEDLCSSLSLDHVKLTAGQEIGLEDGSYLKVLGPFSLDEKDENNNSLVMKLYTGDNSFLFTGDMCTDEENELLSSGEDLSANVLKVAHHGYSDATSINLVSAVNPEVAVISTSTSIEPTSNSSSVRAALSKAQIYVTEDYSCGILMAEDKDGKINVSQIEAQKPSSNLEILAVDKAEQTVTIKNNGGETDISGYFIYSTYGSEIYAFPKDSVIAQGGTITLACKGHTGDYVWSEKKAWSTKNDDSAVLYDKYGNMLSQCDSQ